MKRREFIILTGLSASRAWLLSAGGHAEEKLIPACIHDEAWVAAAAVNIAGIRTVSPGPTAMSILKLGRGARLAQQLALKGEGGYVY
jgi:hypothetical protein